MGRHLAQLNIATLRHPIDHPQIADFVDALPTVNALGEQSAGYVWRLQSDSGNATDIQVFDDPLIIINLTVWASLADLKAFAYRGTHRDFFRRRGEWFVDGASRTALWWLPIPQLPTTEDAKRRLDFIDAFGTSPFAFEIGQHHPPLVVDVAAMDDPRTRQLRDQLEWDVDSAVGSDGAFVVAELDDVPRACGAYARLDADTAVITRVHVAEAARAQRVGAAIVAQLETVARAAGVTRLLFETSADNDTMLPLYERFGFRVSQLTEPREVAPSRIMLEKSLAAQTSRLA